MYSGLSNLPAPTGAYASLPAPTGAYAGSAGGGGGGGLGGLMGFLGPYGGMQLGGGIGSMVGSLFSDPSAAGRVYQDYLTKSMNALQQHETQGRQDLSGYYKQALGFGDPYRTAGQGALSAYQGSVGLGGPGAQQKAYQSFQASPGYQFALQQGLQGVKRHEAAAGLTGSGAEMKALQQYGQGLAGQEYGQYQQRLAGLAGMGQQEAGRAAQMAYGTGAGLAGLGTQYAGPISSLYGQMGQAAATSEAAKQQQPGQILGDIGQVAGLAAMFL